MRPGFRRRETLNFDLHNVYKHPIHTHDPSMSSESKPGILWIMGDYTTPEILAMVSRCSKQAHESITPLLQRKLKNKEEMCQMVLRFYPSITGLPEEASAEYYMRLICYTVIPIPSREELRVFVGVMISSRVYTTNDGQRALGYVYSAMRSPEGRETLKRAIREYQENVGLDRGTIERLKELDLKVTSDFIARFVRKCTREALCKRRARLGL